MKKFHKVFIIIAIALLTINMVKAQGCLPEGITFSSQAEIDDFQTNYPGCTHILGNVTISNTISYNIENLNGLSPLEAVDGNLLIKENYGLLSFNGLNNLKRVGGNFSSLYNYFIADLQGLESLDSIDGKFVINSCNQITSLEGLEKLLFVGGNLSIYWNNGLISLNGLDNLNHIGGGVDIDINAKLIDIDILHNFNEINGYLNISNNHVLADLTGLQNIQHISGDFNIGNNASLHNFDGLNNLETIGGNFTVDNNSYLYNLSGLDKLHSIGGHLGFNHNSSLTTLDALSILTQIGGGITITWNEPLSNLTGLDNIPASSITSLNIVENRFLSTCEAKSICDYLARPDAQVFIADNAPSCNSREEVMLACELVDVKELELGSAVLYPNPTDGYLTIETSKISPGANIYVINLSGQLIYETILFEGQTVIDIHHLAKGLYMLRIIDKEKVFQQKFIKG